MGALLVNKDLVKEVDNKGKSKTILTSMRRMVETNCTGNKINPGILYDNKDKQALQKSIKTTIEGCINDSEAKDDMLRLLTGGELSH